MAFIGNTVQNQGFIPAVDYFSGNGSTTAFTLSRPVASVAQVEAVISNVVQDPATAYTVSGNTLTFTSAPPSGTNNIYVRYTSLITQVIAPSQGTVGNTQFSSSTTSIPFAAGGPLGGGNASIMKNRIINGAMVISQRNGTSSATIPIGSTYTLDRWVAEASAASKFSVQQNAGSVTPPVGFTNYLGATSLSAYSVSATDYLFINQKIEGFNFSDLGWGTANAKTITISAWVRSSLTGTFGGVLYNADGSRSYPFTYTISSANTWTQISVTISGDTTGTWATDNSTAVNVIFSLGAGSSVSGTTGAWASALYRSATGATSVVGTNGATFYITGVQLEVGSSATGFEYRQYGTELALCQRYCQVFTSDATATYARFGMASIYLTTQAFVQVPLKTTMRTSPSLTTGTVSNYTLSTFGNAFTCTALTINSFGNNPNIASILATVSSGLTAGAVGELAANGTSSASLQFSAEL